MSKIIFSKIFLMLAFFFALSFSPPESKAQALLTGDTLKNLDTIYTVTVAPYGDNVTFTIIDSSDSKVDTVKVYEIINGNGKTDTIGVDATLEGAKFDSMVVNTTFIPGDNTKKTYVLRNRQPWKLIFIRTNANNYTPKTYIYVRARTKFINSNDLDKTQFNQTAYVGYLPERWAIINDKFTYLRGMESYNYALPYPFAVIPNRAKSFRGLKE